MLDKKELQEFLKEISKHVTLDRSYNYKEANFDKIFEEFDDDKNGFIQKSEMANFLKKIFKKPAFEFNKLKA